MNWSRLIVAPWLAAIVLSTTSSVQAGWVDEDTPEDKRTMLSLIDGTEYELVMSDEFNVPGRSFGDGDDPTWTALDKSDDDSSAAGGGSLQFYNSSTVSTTDDGLLEIRSKVEKTEWEQIDPIKNKRKTVTKHFSSGMVQSWNKFCFTGGIIEVDVIFPGDPYIGGLWPAVWLLGNLGRATYEGSTNNIWPWSYDTCDREKQQAQSMSACNAQNHYGMNPFQGRGATEIDLIEINAGLDDGPIAGTEPEISYPYSDLTLQVAPGIKDNRPQSGKLPFREDTKTASGFTAFLAQQWYDGLITNGNTTINPYFYGTYLGETKPEEPVHRNKKQVFQADAVGAMHQMTQSHFESLHTIRLEWQPGEGGRLDWFLKDHRVNATFSMTGDGLGQDWVHAFGIRGESLGNTTGAQIPIEPSYIIMNTGISSTWGFPYGVPDTCEKCYDCTNTTCACSFNPGFCNMMQNSEVAMKVDFVRVYQTTNHSAHVGQPHSVGCDPEEYPTKEYIKGHEYLYMRSAPFVYDDKFPLKKIKNGGGKCKASDDCGDEKRGACVEGVAQGFLNGKSEQKRCKCNDGYTGPHCKAVDKKDDLLGAWELSSNIRLFSHLPRPNFPITLSLSVILLTLLMICVMVVHVIGKKREISAILGGEYQMVSPTANER